MNPPAATGIDVAAVRTQLHAEIHARPYQRFSAPALVTYLVLHTGTEGASAGAQARDELIAHFDLEPCASDVAFYAAEDHGLRLVWEQHTEFCRFTLIEALSAPPSLEPGAHRRTAALPAPWLGRWAHLLFIHSEVFVAPATDPASDEAQAARFFGDREYAGATIADGAASIFADFSADAQGLNRALILDRGMTPIQTGRNVQRLLEVYTYWLTALLAFPVARALLPYLSARELKLQQINEGLTAPTDAEGEASALNELTALEAELSQQVSRNAYRFGAAQAYYEIVQQRLKDLREQRITGLQTLTEFSTRRLAPAMKTCQTVADRQQRLAERAFGVTRLLATRIEMDVQLQNREVLASLDRRAELQLRLQSTVEGLSIAAITYYLIGLVSYCVDALIKLGVPLVKEWAVALAIPAVALIVAMLVRRIRARLHASEVQQLGAQKGAGG